MQYLGVDIGGTAVKLGIVDDTGSILYSDSYDVNFDGYQTPIIETVIKSIKMFLEKYQVDSKELSKIGVSATGQIDTKKGSVIGAGGNIINWIGVNIKDRLEAEFGIYTTVVNDANCMIIGEQWKGAAINKQNVIGITIGTGVGGGIIIDGNILLGNVGIAGELGHFSIAEDGVTCTCGNKGCYERYASTTALVRMVKERYIQLNIKEPVKSINGKIIFEYGHAGNQEVLSIIDEWLNNIASGLVSLIHIFNPESIVLGGGVCGQEELFLKPLKEKVFAKAMPRFQEHLEIKSALLGNNAGLVGAVHYAIEH